MTECFSPEVRDFLPDLVHGRLGEVDTATMLAHIEACDACADEVELLRAVRRDAALAPAIDVAGIVAALPSPKVTPVMVPPAKTPPRPGAWKLIATAAVVVVAAVTGLGIVDDPSKVGLPGAAETAATAEAAASPSVASESLAIAASFGDLTDDQLEELIGDLENIEAIPSAEPDVAVVGVSQDLGAVQ
jgi:anti-sigma factor RsiW